MSSATVEPQSTWDQLVHVWRALEVPNGWRAEILGEEITVTPPPGTPHNFIAHRLHRSLARNLDASLALMQTLGLEIPAVGCAFIPDLVVIPEAVLLNEANAPVDDASVPAEHALLVVEITSKSNADTDRKTKLSGYAHAPVPLYLLIDRFAEDGPSVTVYSNPVDGRYELAHTVSFGAELHLPEPIDYIVDTSEF